MFKRVSSVVCQYYCQGPVVSLAKGAWSSCKQKSSGQGRISEGSRSSLSSVCFAVLFQTFSLPAYYRWAWLSFYKGWYRSVSIIYLALSPLGIVSRCGHFVFLLESGQEYLVYVSIQRFRKRQFPTKSEKSGCAVSSKKPMLSAFLNVKDFTSCMSRRQELLFSAVSSSVVHAMSYGALSSYPEGYFYITEKM